MLGVMFSYKIELAVYHEIWRIHVEIGISSFRRILGDLEIPVRHQPTFELGGNRSLLAGQAPFNSSLTQPNTSAGSGIFNP